MRASGRIPFAALAAAVSLSGCATSPEAQARRETMEQDIAEILSAPLDPTEYGETKRCLSDAESRGFRVLDDRRILFQGSRNRLWLNTLRTRCPDLRYSTMLRVKSVSWGRICDTDTFYAGDWFDWPWYRRWPWHWGSGWGTEIPCRLGRFQPVTEGQVAEIEDVLQRRW